MKKTLKLAWILIWALGIVSYAFAETKPFVVSDTGCTGFVEKEDLEKWFEFHRQRDYDAGTLFLFQKLISKEAYKFKTGETVYVSGKMVGGGKPVKIRKKGETKEYYVLAGCFE